MGSTPLPSLSLGIRSNRNGPSVGDVEVDPLVVTNFSLTRRLKATFEAGGQYAPSFLEAWHLIRSEEVLCLRLRIRRLFLRLCWLVQSSAHETAGFEAGGQYTPSSIEPWRPIGSEPDLWLETQKASVFEGNPIALKFEARGVVDENGQLREEVGFSNPGYWGMVSVETLLLLAVKKERQNSVVSSLSGMYIRALQK